LRTSPTPAPAPAPSSIPIPTRWPKSSRWPGSASLHDGPSDTATKPATRNEQIARLAFDFSSNRAAPDSADPTDHVISELKHQVEQALHKGVHGDKEKEHIADD
jgi:hypothetical protein